MSTGGATVGTAVGTDRQVQGRLAGRVLRAGGQQGQHGSLAEASGFSSAGAAVWQWWLQADGQRVSQLVRQGRSCTGRDRGLTFGLAPQPVPHRRRSWLGGTRLGRSRTGGDRGQFVGHSPRPVPHRRRSWPSCVSRALAQAGPAQAVIVAPVQRPAGAAGLV